MFYCLTKTGFTTEAGFKKLHRMKMGAEVGVDKKPTDFGHTRLAFNELCGKENLAWGKICKAAHMVVADRTSSFGTYKALQDRQY